MAGGSEGMPLPTDELGTLYRSVNVALLVLALISVLMRCFVRIGMLKSFGVDDYWMLVATVRLFRLLAVDRAEPDVFCSDCELTTAGVIYQLQYGGLLEC